MFKREPFDLHIWTSPSGEVKMTWHGAMLDLAVCSAAVVEQLLRKAYATGMPEEAVLKLQRIVLQGFLEATRDAKEASNG